MKNLIQTALVTLFAASAAHAQQAVQWKVSDGGNGHWYQAIPSGLGDWYEARTAALVKGADLASIGSAEENMFVGKLLNAGGFHNFFVGALVVSGSPCNPSAWRWSDGTVWTYTNWDMLQPECNTETVATMYSSGKWHNYLPAGQGVLGAIIEWSADCNADNIVDYGQILDGSLIDENGNGVPDCCEQGLSCISCSAFDLNPTGIVDGADLGALLAFWGPVSPAFPRADINRDGNVNGADLGLLLANWGPCGQ